MVVGPGHALVWFVVGADECVALGGVVLSQAGFWQTLGGSGLKLAGAGVGFSRVLCRRNAQTPSADGLRSCGAAAARLWAAGRPRMAASGLGLPAGLHSRPVGGGGGGVVRVPMAVGRLLGAKAEALGARGSG